MCEARDHDAAAWRNQPPRHRAARKLCLMLALLTACSDDQTNDSSEADAGDAFSNAGDAGSGLHSAGSSGSGMPRAGGSAASSGAGTTAAGSHADRAGSGASQHDAAMETQDPVDSGSAHGPVSSGCADGSGAAPATTWINATGNLAGLSSECGNLTLVAADPCNDRVIAGVAHSGLWSTSAGSGTWTQLGTGAGSEPIVHRPSSIVFDPEQHDVFYESGIYGALDDGVYKTSDGGETLKRLSTMVGHVDLVSIDFADPGRKTLLAGAHETKQKLFLSRDGGESWTDIGAKLPAGSHFSSAPLVLDPQHFLLGACGWGDGTCGVFASDDGGDSWQQTSMESPAGAPLWAADGHLVWPTIWGSGAILSDNLGQSWTKVEGPHAGAPIELPDHRIVAVGGDHLIISTDHGATWSNLGEPLPYQPAGVTYSPSGKTFYIWHNDCGEVVLPDAIMSAGFDGG